MSEQNKTNTEPTPMPDTTMVVDAFPTEEEQAPQHAAAAQAQTTPEPGSPRKRVISHVFSGLGLALGRPRVLLTLVCLSLLLGLPTAVAVYSGAFSGVGQLVEHPTDAKFDFLQVAPSWVLGEWQRSSPGLMSGVGSAITPSVLAASIFGLLVCAGFMGIAASRKREHSLISFLREGGTWFFPFFRTWILGMPLFFAVTWLFWSNPGDWVMKQFLTDGDINQANSESIARWITGSREVLYLLALVVVELCLDLGRAAMVVGGKSSALLAVLRGVGQFLLEPLRALGVVSIGFAIELAWLAVCLEAAKRELIPMWSLAVLIPLGRISCRGARYAGLVGLVGETRAAPSNS